MQLYLFCNLDYKTGRKLEVYDIQDLIHKYNFTEKYNNKLSICDKSVDKLDKKDIDKTVEKAMDDNNLLSTIDIEPAKGDKYSIYFITCDFIGRYNTKHITNVVTPETSKTILRSIFSDINGFQEFAVTGLTDGYREEGYYPDPLSQCIVDGTLIYDIVSEQLKNNPQYCIAVSLHNGRLHDYIQVHPLF
jgi:hypothetical protein